MPSTQTAAVADRVETLVERLTEAAAGTFDVLAIYLGDELGLFRALNEIGPLTATELAEATRLYRRAVREWLEHGAASGLLQLVADADDPNERRYALPEVHAQVLVNRDSLSYWAPMARQLVATVGQGGLIINAFRTGRGFTLGDTGDEMRTGEATANRQAYLSQLGQDWLPAAAGVVERLQSEPSAWIADVGCGLGWSSIAMALAFPLVRVDGVDLDEPSIEAARRHAVDSGVEDRVTFRVASADQPGLSGRYDLVTVLEAFHDMARPVAVLQALRASLAPGGSIVIADTKAGDRFSPPTDARERLHYGWSLSHCLYSSFGGPEDQQTGSMLRPATLRRYASAAGLGVDILPIEHDSWQFYQLKPAT
jgi:SAM-dependent methyltransferase